MDRDEEGRSEELPPEALAHQRMFAFLITIAVAVFVALFLGAHLWLAGAIDFF